VGRISYIERIRQNDNKEPLQQGVYVKTFLSREFSCAYPDSSVLIVNLELLEVPFSNTL
jgi:hypothetical protein